MGMDRGQINGILAYVTTDKDRYLGGNSLALLAKDKEKLVEISEAIAEAFLANILQLVNGDCLIINNPQGTLANLRYLLNAYKHSSFNNII